MKLNDRQIRNAKPAEKSYKLNDGKGLYLYINTSGGKLWRFDFSYNGKRKTLSIGKYPTVSLVEARQAAENARRMLAAGQDPGEAKQQEKAERKAAALNTFESLARRWHTDNLHRWKPKHAARLSLLTKRGQTCNTLQGLKLFPPLPHHDRPPIIGT
ncbi:MAG: Arm DNA-binding domain-containing protein [Neisseria sp.]|nr:Arm DNA-binding domain-containing protein [Neisseria sp.]